jgi:glutamate dehydrogenase
MIDLLIPGQNPGIKEHIVDLYNKPELLFFGPDGRCLKISLMTLYSRCLGMAEGTADMMDWAACMFSVLVPLPVPLMLKVT